MRISLWRAALGLILVVAIPLRAGAAEICGNGLDDDSNGMADEGCNPYGVTGICEGPLGCDQIGSVAPRLGALVYGEPPDVVIRPAYGPDLILQRTYASKYDPGYATWNNRNSFGYRWQHNFMSWVDLDTSPSPDTAVLHTTTGQDVFLTRTSGDATYDYFTAQAGWYFKEVRRQVAAGSTQYDWRITHLDGRYETYDGHTPVAGKDTALLKNIYTSTAVGGLTVSYDGSSRVSTVETDGSAMLSERLRFTYNATGLIDNVYIDIWDQVDSVWTLGYKRYAYTYTGTAYLSEMLEYQGATSTTIRGYTYDSNNFLSKVADTATSSNVLVQFSWADAAGKLARADHAEGAVAYTWSDATCDSGNGMVELFNKKGISCSTDADCSGGYCGGALVGTGTKMCYAAKRCVASTTSAGEHLVSTITGFCGSLSADRCLTIKEYQWDTSSTKINVKATKDPDDVWTSYLYDANGRVTRIVENDSDSDASTIPVAARTDYYFYGNATFPGLLTESRRLSELKPAGTCTDTISTDCKRTTLTYSSLGMLTAAHEIGFTLDATGSTVAFDYLSQWGYDALGRLSSFTGPRAGVADDIVYLSNTASGTLSYGHLQYVKYQKAVGDYITTTYDDYDAWGHARSVAAPSGLTCRTYEAKWGKLSTSRVVVDAAEPDVQVTCGASDTGADDMTTSYTYDGYGRLSRIQQPKLNCIDYGYDTSGRLSTMKELDYVSGACASSGNYTQLTYGTDGQISRKDWKTSAGTVVRTQDYNYDPDRRLSALSNPVDATKKKQYDYDDDGMLAVIRSEDWPGSGTEKTTEFDVDSLNRPTALRRFKAAGSADQWTLTPGLFSTLLNRIRDQGAHDINLVHDDLDRTVKQVTAEAGATVLVYDEAGNLITKVQALGGADQSTDTYTYDALNRRVGWNTGDASCGVGATDELVYTYDALGAGVSCPTGATCNNLRGQLAWVKVKMWCDGTKADKTFDQITFYGYDDAARVNEHEVTDDSGRLARVAYTYDKNGNVATIAYPAVNTTLNPNGSQLTYVYDGSAQVSDANRVREMRRDGVALIDSILWMPSGPVDRFYQESTISGWKVLRDFTYNLAYRLSSIYAYKDVAPISNVFKIDYSEDSRGRYTARDFSYGTSAQRDMFLLYDDLDRISCRRDTNGATCPTTGPRESVSYNTSSDRSAWTISNNALIDQTFTPSYLSSSDAIDFISQTGGWSIDYAWDGRGNRKWDDSTEASGSGDDKRTYTYDARNNLVSVVGKFYVSFGVMHDYVVANAYDESNRRVFKSFKDTTAVPNVESQWFFYYDNQDRLITAKHTPDISVPSTYSVYQWYWLEAVPVVYYQLDCTGSTCPPDVSGPVVTRRYLYADEQGRPHAAWSWPTSGDTARVWEIEAGTFGWDIPTVGPTIFQPLRFPGQYYDRETEVHDAINLLKRPGLADNRHRFFDAFTGAFLQFDLLIEQSWEAYTYAANNTVANTDRTGLLIGRPVIHYPRGWWDAEELTWVDGPWFGGGGVGATTPPHPPVDPCTAASNDFGNTIQFDCKRRQTQAECYTCMSAAYLVCNDKWQTNNCDNQHPRPPGQVSCVDVQKANQNACMLAGTPSGVLFNAR